MKRLITVIALAVLASGCGTKTRTISDVSKSETVLLDKQAGQGPIHSITVIGSGRLNGEAEISLILNDGPYKTARLSGAVDFRWGGDWYSDQAEIRYTPISATYGKLKLKYRFNDL